LVFLFFFKDSSLNDKHQRTAQHSETYAFKYQKQREREREKKTQKIKVPLVLFVFFLSDRMRKVFLGKTKTQQTKRR